MKDQTNNKHCGGVTAFACPPNRLEAQGGQHGAIHSFYLRPFSLYCRYSIICMGLGVVGPKNGAEGFISTYRQEQGRALSLIWDCDGTKDMVFNDWPALILLRGDVCLPAGDSTLFHGDTVPMYGTVGILTTSNRRGKERCIGSGRDYLAPVLSNSPWGHMFFLLTSMVRAWEERREKREERSERERARKNVYPDVTCI